MDINVNFNSVSDVITNLERIKGNIETCYKEKVTITSYAGSKKDEIENYINNKLFKASSKIATSIDDIINQVKKINGMYVEANIDNSKIVNTLNG